MASNTTRLGLLKKNPVTDGNDTFNIETMLNENWDKVDKNVALIDPTTGKLLNQENVVDLPDASITRKGVVQLEDGTSSTSSTRAATANALNKLRLLVSNVQNYGVASKLEAEAGTSNVKYMTPLRVFEAIKKLVVKNVPDGYAGLDGDGKLINEVIPSSIEAYEQISFVDFNANPAAVLNVSNLGDYKKIVVKFLQTKTTSTSNTAVTISYNGVVGTSAYVGSTTTGVLNSQTLLISTAAAYPTVNGELEINNDNPYYMTEIKSYTETIDGISGSHSIGFASLRSKRNDRLQNIQFAVSSSNMFNGGAIEILGVRR